LAAAVQHQGFGIISAAAAAWPLGAAVLDYRKDVMRHPAFFLWKLLSKNAPRIWLAAGYDSLLRDHLNTLPRMNPHGRVQP
jgi:hypothetical protein